MNIRRRSGGYCHSFKSSLENIDELLFLIVNRSCRTSFRSMARPDSGSNNRSKRSPFESFTFDLNIATFWHELILIGTHKIATRSVPPQIRRDFGELGKGGLPFFDWGAHAPRVLAIAPRDRGLSVCCLLLQIGTRSQRLKNSLGAGKLIISGFSFVAAAKLS